MKPATVTRNFAKCLLAALVAVACTAEASKEQAPVNTEPVSPIVSPRKAVVEFDDTLIALIEEDLEAGRLETKSAPLNTALEELGIVGMQRVFPDAGEFEPRTRREGLHRFYRVEFSQPTSITKAQAGLSAVPGVVSVSPVRKVRRRGFNDPLFSRQWHFVNATYENADINVERVWGKYTKGRSNVLVCVVDGGVCADHPDLSDNMWRDASGRSGFNFVRNNYEIVPDGHGTHVAGIIGAVSNNGIGVAGIAGGDAEAGIPGVRIMTSAIFEGDDGADDNNTWAAIKWGADNGAVLSNNSWGYYADGCLDGDEDGIVSEEELRVYKGITLDRAAKAAIDYFIKYAGCDNDGNQLPDSPMKGGLFFCAAGNEDIDYDIVSSYKPVISVGAFGAAGEKASYSNYGSYVDIAAPGGDGLISGDSIWSTVPTSSNSSGYAGAGWSGTSMACPHAVGMAALVISYFGGPGFTQETCREIILDGLGKTVGGSKPIGRKLDAVSIFENGFEVMGKQNPGTPMPPVISLSKTAVTLKAHEKVTIAVSASDPNFDEITLSCNPGSDALTFNPESGQAVIVGRNAPAGTYKAVFTATDQTGLSTDAVLEYTLLPNHPPVVSTHLEDRILQKEESIASPFRDDDGETLTLQVKSTNTMVLRVGVSDSSVIDLVPIGDGVVTVTLTATDGLGESVSQSFRVAVRTSSRSMDIYPVPASTEVNFWPDSLAEQPLKVTLYSVTGSKVLSADFSASVFLPAVLDISSLAPGKYTALLEYGGTSWRETVVKI